MFKVQNTGPVDPQTGMAELGAGAQQTGYAVAQPRVERGEPVRPTKGFRSWLNVLANGGRQRGYPSPEAPEQRRPKGSMPNKPPVFGGVAFNKSRDMDRGASAYVPITGKLLYNPIGAGIPALYRPKAYYGPSGQYADGAIWWTSQQIPTSVNLAGLTSPDELASLLNDIQIQAVVRTTG